MLLTADVGNTHITIGAFKGEQLSFTARLATDTKRTEDQYAAELMDILRINGVGRTDFKGAIIGSVVPVLTNPLRSAVEKAIGTTPTVVGPGVRTGLNIRIEHAAQLGADLACGAVAAMETMPLPCVVVDLGTATKLYVVDATGAFLGGTIAAGVGISMGALAERTAQLPYVAVEAPKKTVCGDTAESMKAGAVFGTAAMIDGMIDRMEAELGTKVSVVATGGYSKVIAPHCKREITLDPDLLLKGLRSIYLKNA